MTAYELSKTARAKLPVPKPRIKTAPPRGTLALVGMPHWFWLAKIQWHHRSATATLDHLSATVTAHPTRLVIDPGDGTGHFTCTPPWTPYSPQATPTCTHTFARHGRYQVTATVTWGATWHGSDGDGGGLPALSRSTRFTIRVAQGESQLISNP